MPTDLVHTLQQPLTALTYLPRAVSLTKPHARSMPSPLCARPCDHMRTGFTLIDIHGIGCFIILQAAGFGVEISSAVVANYW